MSITGDSPEAVAFALLERIADAEDWSSSGNGRHPDRTIWKWNKPREEILSVYRQCIEAVKNTSP